MKKKTENPYNKAVVEKIRVICKERQTPYTSLTKLEAALDMGNGVIGGWIHSKRTPPIDLLHQIAALLNVPLSAILPDSDTSDPTFDLQYFADSDKKSADLSVDALREDTAMRLSQLTPEEWAKVDAFVQGLLASR